MLGAFVALFNFNDALVVVPIFNIALLDPVLRNVALFIVALS